MKRTTNPGDAMTRAEFEAEQKKRLEEEKNKPKQNQEENEMKTMRECCPLKVDELITANTKFKAEDKEMLLNLTEDGFARVIEMAEPTIKEVIKEVVKEVKVNVAPEPPKTFEELLANADPKIRESVQHGQTLIARERANMVTRIKTNKSNVFTDAELDGFDLTMLSKLAELVPAPVNWMPVGGSRTIVNAEEVPALPDTGNSWEPEKK